MTVTISIPAGYSDAELDALEADLLAAYSRPEDVEEPTARAVATYVGEAIIARVGGAWADPVEVGIVDESLSGDEIHALGLDAPVVWREDAGAADVVGAAARMAVDVREGSWLRALVVSAGAASSA